VITYCTEVISAWLVKHEAIEPDDRELYEYAVHSLLLTLSPLILIMIIGGLMGLVKESILIIIPFMVIRKFSGGFHAKHEWTCLIASCALLFLCLYAVSHIKCGMLLSIVTFGGVISLMICSPIDSENRRLQLNEKKRYKFMTGVIAFAFAIVYILFYLHGADTYAACIAVGLLLSAGLQIPCIPQLIKSK